MHLKQLLTHSIEWRSHRRAFALILLALLTLASILIFSTQPVTGTKQPPTQLSSPTSGTANAQKLAIQGQQLYLAGQFSEAAKVWQEAANAYAQVGDKGGVTQSQINIAQALQALGNYPRACNTLLQAFNLADSNCQNLTQKNENLQPDSWLKTLENRPNSQTQVIGLRSLGDVLQKLDYLELSTKVLQLSLNAAQKLPSSENESAALLSLGNTFQALGNRAFVRLDTSKELQPYPWRCLYRPSIGEPKKIYQQAASYYQQAATVSVSSTTRVQAEINRLGVLLETNALSDAQNLWTQIQSQLKDLPINRTTLYAQLNLAENLTCLKQATTDVVSWKEIAQTLARTLQQARNLGDQRAESYAQGHLGALYLQGQTQPSVQELTYAQDLTQKALMLAQAIQAEEIVYKWQWQLGYIFKTQGDITGALSTYTEAVKTLQSLRSDLSVNNRNLQFSFSEGVEPVYRQLVDLLLQSNETSQNNLQQARETIEALQLAELENLLGCSLTVASSVSIEQKADPAAAVIYPIILDNRIEIIFSLYEQPLRHYSKLLSKEQNLENQLEILRQNLRTPNSMGFGFLKSSQQVYSLLIEPIEDELEKNGVKTLVFVLDSPLRQIPMAALYDGQHYLIEKYAIAISPSLQLLQPKALSKEKPVVLAAGIYQKIPGSETSALPEVKNEIDFISQATKSTVLRNQEFTRKALETKINSRPYSVVHLATHGQFSSQPDQTYIWTWDGRVNLNQLKTLLESREQSRPDVIELLVLSACETAEGDRNSALGLAGVSVQAGARSTLASLWQVNDSSTALLMTQFYQNLFHS
ncbi:CHAT domain-containing protein, partial [Nostoc commune]|uniref:CHAT domain-containing protein n=1 Tax=Nostoc commune TaxID=1178 RepID=UPI001E3D6E03